jgi:hypothetical protein
VTRTRLLLSTALLLVSFAALGDGTLTVNGKTVKLDHSYATTKKNPFDKKKTVVLVLFTDRELPAGAMKDDFTLMEARDKTHFNGVSAEIDDEKKVIGCQIYSSSLKKTDQFSSIGTQKLDVTAMTPTRIAGKLYMPKEEDFFDDKFIYNITFDVPIGAASANAAPPPSAAPAGKPLPADGGEPRKAYDAYRKVLASGDMAALRKAVSADRVSSMDDPDFKKMFPMIQEMEPKNVKYLNGTIDGDKATLNVSAKNGKEQSTGTVSMVREGGKWKVSKEEWQSKSSD